MRLPLLTRVVIAGWMLGGLMVALACLTLPLFVTFGVVRWLTGPTARLAWLEVGLSVAIWLVLCASLWITAGGASTIARKQGPSRLTLVFTAAVGLALGAAVGIWIRPAWGAQIAYALGLPPAWFNEHVVPACALVGYTAASFAGTYLRRGQTFEGAT